jgi:hypothetical protein
LGFDNTIILALEGSKLVDNITAGPPHTVMVADKSPRISKHKIFIHTLHYINIHYLYDPNNTNTFEVRKRTSKLSSLKQDRDDPPQQHPQSVRGT